MTTVSQARDSSRIKPVYLVQLTLKNSGPTLYFSDRNITVAGQLYESYLHDLSGVAQELKRADSTALNVNTQLSFRNDKISYNGTDYANLITLGQTYPFETSTCQIFETYLDDNQNPSDTVLIFKGVLDCPANIDLMGFKCKVSTMPMYMDARWQQTQLDTVDFPAATDDVGKWVPIVYGSDILMPALRVDWTKTTLVSSIAATDTSMEITDVTGFSDSGSIMIDDEVIAYTAISSRMLTGITRGASGTSASPHGANADVVPYQSSYDWVLAVHPLQSVGDIFAEIGGKLWLVTSGISSLFDADGYMKLRASSAISVGGVLDNISLVNTTVINDGITVNDSISLNDPGHSHSMTAGDPVIGSGAATSDNGNISWSGSAGNVIDQCDTTYMKALGKSFSGWGKIQINFPAYSGAEPTAVYLCITHQTYSGGAVTARVSGDNSTWYNIDGSQQKETQKIYFGTTVPSSMWAYFNNPSGSTVMYMQVFEMWLEVHTRGTAFATAGISKQGTVTKSGTVTLSGDVTKGGTVVSTVTVERLHAVVNGYADDANGTYTGTAGAVIERPDSVIKHFLEVASGVFSSADIDPASFSAAGDWYATNGYQLAFALDKKVKPSQWLSQLAWESRSTFVYNAGFWELNVIRDAAPAAVKTISKADLAGQNAMFAFGKTDWQKISNWIVASYDKQYTTIPGKSQSGWLGTALALDATSQGTYGIFKKEIQFEAVRTPAMAQSVLNHMLLEAKNPNLTVTFPVFWENFDLKVGDTIAIENDIFGGALFFIEQIIRKDAFRATIKAVGWW